jgi:hypothetical protein
VLRSLEAAQQVTSQPSPLPLPDITMMHGSQPSSPFCTYASAYVNVTVTVTVTVRSAQRREKRNWKLCVWLGATAKDGEPISSPIDRGRTDVRTSRRPDGRTNDTETDGEGRMGGWRGEHV